MPYAKRSFTCPDCGTWHERRAPEGSEQRCTTCAVAHSGENARQLHAHDGPLFNAWAHAMMAWARRAAVSPADEKRPGRHRRAG